jgi:N-acetylated-alpha-linked acidic dipeptidase
LQITVSNYAAEIEKLADQLRDNNAIENQLIKSGSYQYAADPSDQFIAPKSKPEVPAFDFSELNKALAALKTAANNLSSQSTKDLSKASQLKLNTLLFQAEKQLLNNDGLPQRPWYKHTIYAPGFYTGYGVKTLPGIRESIEQGDWEEASKQLKIATQRLNNLAKYLGSASAK